MTFFIVILLVGLGTYFSRAVFILVLADRHISPGVKLAMEYVGPSVLAALVVTMLVTPEGELVLGYAELVALLVAGVLAWKSRSHLLTLAVSMVVFWSLRMLLA